MKRIVLIGFSIVALVCAAGAGSRADGATPVADDLRFEVRFHDTFVTATDTGLRSGDRVILSDRLVQGGGEVGHNAGVCTVTDATAGEMVCTVTWVLPDGTISTQLFNTPPPRKVFAIIGGTGAYAGAGGTGELIEHGDETGSVSFDLDL